MIGKHVGKDYIYINEETAKYYVERDDVIDLSFWSGITRSVEKNLITDVMRDSFPIKFANHAFKNDCILYAVVDPNNTSLKVFLHGGNILSFNDASILINELSKTFVVINRYDTTRLLINPDYIEFAEKPYVSRMVAIQTQYGVTNVETASQLVLLRVKLYTGTLFDFSGEEAEQALNWFTSKKPA